MIKSSLFFISIFIFTSSYGQECNCEKNFEWVKQTFEQNDAGFKYALDLKGQNAYENHNANYLLKVKASKNLGECTNLLFQWLKFFRPEHIAIRPIVNNFNNNSSNKKQPKTKDDNWETLNVNLKAFEEKLNDKKEVDFEGIWEMQSYKIGIEKREHSYIGFIIDSKVENWKKGQVKLRINVENGKNTGTLYLRDKTPEHCDNIELIGKNHIQFGNFRFKRISPILNDDKEIAYYFKSTLNESPFIEEINNNLVLRIPSFSDDAKSKIDSILSSNKAKILQTKNLIIDLRNNGGGNDDSYTEIIPYIYTNPIRTIGLELLSTELNNKRMLGYLNDPDYELKEDERKMIIEAIDKLNNNLGKFVNVENQTVTIDSLSEIFSNPKNVAIIINEGCASTTEQFLLAAKQSRKVKLFGTTTLGVLDISNMNFVISPCNEFEFGYCISKTLRIPEMTIDGKGIQPDYYIDKSIPNYKWLDFINEILKAQ